MPPPSDITVTLQAVSAETADTPEFFIHVHDQIVSSDLTAINVAVTTGSSAVLIAEDE